MPTYFVLASIPNVGLDGSVDALGGLGLLGFLRWLVFIATSSVTLIRHSGEQTETNATMAAQDIANMATQDVAN